MDTHFQNFFFIDSIICPLLLRRFSKFSVFRFIKCYLHFNENHPTLVYRGRQCWAIKDDQTRLIFMHEISGSFTSQPSQQHNLLSLLLIVWLGLKKKDKCKLIASPASQYAFFRQILWSHDPLMGPLCLAHCCQVLSRFTGQFEKYFKQNCAKTVHCHTRIY